MLFKRDQDNLEHEFLPPALEISETPPSPLGRFMIWFFFLFFMVAMIWSYFGKIDVVAVARGKIIPDQRVKVIQPLEEGIVTAIHINEGEKVTQGQLLVELDATIKAADVDSLAKSLYITELEKEILDAELQGKSLENLSASKKLQPDVVQTQKQFKEAREREYFVKQESLELLVLQRQDELLATESSLKETQKKIAILKEEEGHLAKQYKNVRIPKKEWDKKRDELTLAETQAETQTINVQHGKDRLNEAKKNLEALEKERKTTIFNSLVETDKKIETLEAEFIKAQERFRYQKLCSPVDGIVNGLTVTTIGGVVTPAQPIMTIVPLDTPLIVEAAVLNKDIGFIRTGQETKIKFDTFPFQKYGTVSGEVTEVSPDAFEDEKMGSVYKVKVKLEQTTILVDNKEMTITPGMAVSVEIKIGKRRILEFFLDPIVKYLEESLKVR